MRFEKYLNEEQGKGTGKEYNGGNITCKCPECNYTMDHERGTPCNQFECPMCGSMMVGK